MTASRNDHGVVDTHCHLGDYLFPEAVLENACRAGVAVVVATNRPTEYRALRKIYPDADVALGIHPEIAGTVYEPHQLAVFRDEITNATWVSELGLDARIAADARDGGRGGPDYDSQVRMLEEALSYVHSGTLISGHAHGAEKAVIASCAKAPRKGVVLHWFQGNLESARAALDEGFYFSVNPAMLDKQSTRSLLRWLPLDRLLLESDGPFVRFERRICEPADLRRFVTVLAGIKGLSSSNLESALFENYLSLVD